MTQPPPKRRDGLLEGDLKQADETVLVDPESGRVVSLNPTAAAVWNLCDGQTSIDGIAREIQEVFPNEDRALIEQQVRALVHQLRAEGLLQ
jgi:hypothetical protein